ncbi:MAG: AAA family ATPase [Burkholderiales bacterium]|nr:AAA family ATPase [Burkholderiales bacterium]
MSDEAEAEATARARVSALRAALEAQEKAPVRLIETHISWVLLGTREAWKIKKPVCLPFLDFTALADRRRFCEEELRLNRRLAPELYLDVVALRDGPAGPCLGGQGTIVDFAVRMRRFPDGALWSERLAAEALHAGDIDAFARRLAGFHREAAVAPPSLGFGGAPTQERVTRRLITGIDTWQRSLVVASGDWPDLRAWLDAERERLEDHWPLRLRSERIRECHGDLHLANIVQPGDQATAFDAIEFDPEMRWIDVLQDLAFPVMDLLAHGRRDLAFRLLDGWLEASGDFGGLPALRYFLVERALVRAQVEALRELTPALPASACSAHAYLRLAAELAAASDPRLLVTHGLPGSGKTFRSQGLLESVGAVRIRSDVERKRLFGLTALESSRERAGPDLYGASATRATYARLLESVQASLDGGWPTIVDAAFLKRGERGDFAALAAATSAPFTILDCRGSLPLLRRRIEARRMRGGDASEADVAVLYRLAVSAEPLDAQERERAIVVDAEHAAPPGELAARWLSAT